VCPACLCDGIVVTGPDEFRERGSSKIAKASAISHSTGSISVAVSTPANRSPMISIRRTACDRASQIGLFFSLLKIQLKNASTTIWKPCQIEKNHGEENASHISASLYLPVGFLSLVCFIRTALAALSFRIVSGHG
jgi:hypothetical protein